MKKIALALSVMLMVSILLSACSGDNIDPMSESSRTTLPGASILPPQAPDPSLSAISESDVDALEAQAEVLTEHMVSMALDNLAKPNTAAINDTEITRFILTLAFYMDNQEHPYFDCISKTPEQLYIFPLDNIQKIAHELFGRDNWDLGNTISNIDVSYNSDQRRYESGLEFGLGFASYDCQKMDARYVPESSYIEVSFVLLSYLRGEDDPAWGKQEPYRIIFKVEPDNSGAFLRFSGVEPMNAASSGVSAGQTSAQPPIPSVPPVSPAAPPVSAGPEKTPDMAVFLQDLGRWYWGDEHKKQETSKENRENLLPITRQKLAELAAAGAMPQTFADRMTAYLDGNGINYSWYSDGATREMLTCNFGMGTSPPYYISMDYRLETGQVYSLDSSLPFQHSFSPEELDAMLQSYLAYLGLDTLGDLAYTGTLPNIRLMESPSAGLVAGIYFHTDSEKENMTFSFSVRVQD